MAGAKLDAPETVQVIHEWPAGPRDASDVFRVTVQTYRGGRYIHLRRWYLSEDGPEEELRPGKGLALRLDLLPELCVAVDKLVAAAQGA